MFPGCIRGFVHFAKNRLGSASTQSRFSPGHCKAVESGHTGRRNGRRLRTAAVGAVLAAWMLLPLAPNTQAKKPDAWVELRSPHFIVVTNAGEKAARHTAIQFEQIRALFLAVLANGQPQSTRTIAVLALKNEASLRSLIPRYWKGYHARPAGIFSHRMGQFYIALDLSAPGTNPNSTIYHEYFHALSTRYLPNLPAWLAEGLADFYGETQISARGATIGLPDEASMAELTRATPLPLEMLFQIDHASPYYNLRGKAFLFHAESWAVADYLMIADGGAHRRSLFGYISDLKSGMNSLDAAQAEFGNLAKLQTQILEYMRRRSHDHLRAESPVPFADSDLSAQAISEANANIYRGGFLAVQGQPDRAIPLLEHAAADNPSSALAAHNLALALFLAGRREEATAVATRAIAMNSHDAITRYIRAYCSFRGTMLQSNPEMEGDLRAAIVAAPDFAPPYAFLAAYLAAQGTQLDDAYAYARTAVSLDPRNSMYELALAKVLGRMGRYDESHTAAECARTFAFDISDRHAADSFLAFLERRAAHSHATELTSTSEP